jgi:hypothetical protein
MCFGIRHQEKLRQGTSRGSKSMREETLPHEEGARPLQTIRQLCFSGIARVEEFGFVALARFWDAWKAAPQERPDNPAEVPPGWTWSLRWLGVGTYVRSLPKTRIHRALDEILSFGSTVFGKGNSDGLDNQGLYDALRIKAVIIELQDRVPQRSGGAVGLLAGLLVSHASPFLLSARLRGNNSTPPSHTTAQYFACFLR